MYSPAVAWVTFCSTTVVMLDWASCAWAKRGFTFYTYASVLIRQQCIFEISSCLCSWLYHHRSSKCALHDSYITVSTATTHRWFRRVCWRLSTSPLTLRPSLWKLLNIQLMLGDFLAVVVMWKR
ncbi:hypothetical protein E2C01_001273 [Portunus trituberculatus]|uniref:Uncharacterized protein n=1 Tax=Portunus trituberculatus TaxID=210409 RepID=A0A5B7CIW6_PORTR|nr:hypothetical protein [Portunus trituberculatus]